MNVGYYRSAGTIKVGDGSCDSGYCVEPISVTREGNQVGTYYRVTTYVTFDFPIIGQISNFPVSDKSYIWSVGGEVSMNVIVSNKQDDILSTRNRRNKKNNWRIFS